MTNGVQVQAISQNLRQKRKQEKPKARKLTHSMQSVLEQHNKPSPARLSARLVAFLIDTFGIYFGIVALSVLVQWNNTEDV